MNRTLDDEAEARARDLAARTPWGLDSARDVVRVHAEVAPDIDFDRWAHMVQWYGLDGLVATMRTNRVNVSPSEDTP